MYHDNVNPVEKYLSENKGKNLSLRRIYRDLKMKRRKTLWYIHQSKNVKNIKPLEVGCNAQFLHIYTYFDNNI